MDPPDGQRYVESTRTALDAPTFDALEEGRALDLAAAHALLQEPAGRPDAARVPVPRDVTAP